MWKSDASGDRDHDVGYYEIRLQGHLEDRWRRWFAGMAITREAYGETCLSGVADQAALHGLLRRVRDTGMPLLLVRRIDPDQTSGHERNQPSSVKAEQGAAISPQGETQS